MCITVKSVETCNHMFTNFLTLYHNLLDFLTHKVLNSFVSDRNIAWSSKPKHA